jgi:ferrous iron transport protein B
VEFFGFFNSRGLVLTLLYMMGLVAAVLISFVLNRLLFRQERATFMMDMPSYTLPTLRSIYIRIHSRVKSFVGRAGTVILAITIVIWALSYYPRSETITVQYDSRAEQIESAYQAQKAALETPGASSSAVSSDALTRLANERDRALEVVHHERSGAYLRDSYFGRAGRLVAPAFEPLGWDWKITMATLASFPAREVIIATLGTVYNLGGEENETSSSLAEKMQRAVWEDGDKMGQPVFTPAVALSIMVFFALCAQCGATLVTIRHETAAWKYAFTAFAYMTTLAYIAAFTVYQLFKGVEF